IKVGITGSFAKTSVKHIAAAILSSKYRVIATPASYNTPIGIARTVNSEGADCDIFLAEMGARKEGDIKELCEMVRPDFGVITGVCPQHLETFGSLAAIQREKSVLARYAEKGCVLGASAVDLAEGFSAGKDFEAEDVVCTENGTTFTLRLKEERVELQTKLLGKHSAEDIALAGALCYLLGMTVEEIKAGTERIRPIPHRLEKIDGNGVNVLDDSYNSNVEGAKDAVYTLRLFGGRKYVVTPGLVELGQIEEKENAALGELLAGLDGVILVGETLVLAVREGYLKAGGEEGHLRIVPTLEKAQQILAEELQAGDSVLFLNDLPDIYNH
ncbi:MAG: UDP-N-acetylmuramoyl-tripeptide--D-alanyl-D-alanine ligase, partial [Clostridiales bacterium]|nr:UDP-N-acetylmuramoyl-tripeptide--D-alanyl-D-alanine ligase [Clostridiales bacterium]